MHTLHRHNRKNGVFTEINYVYKSHLDHFVPAAGHNDGVAAVGGEAHTGHPFSVAVVLWKRVGCQIQEALDWHTIQDRTCKVYNLSKNSQKTTTKSDAGALPGWCTCRLPGCSTAWWSCLWIQTRSDGCRQRKPRSEHPWCVRRSGGS